MGLTTRQLILQDLSRVIKIIDAPWWKINLKAFKEGKGVQLDMMEFNTNNRRFKFSDEQSESTDICKGTDNAILISMIIFSLFRFKENIGRPSGTKLLTVSPLQPSLEKYPEFDSMQNLWSSEIGEMNRSFKSADNYFNFFNFYAEVHESTWERKAKKKNGERSLRYYVHLFSEQAAIQTAKYIVTNIDGTYMNLANHMVCLASQLHEEEDEMQIWSQIIAKIEQYMKEGPEVVMSHLHD